MLNLFAIIRSPNGFLSRIYCFSLPCSNLAGHRVTLLVDSIDYRLTISDILGHVFLDRHYRLIFRKKNPRVLLGIFSFTSCQPSQPVSYLQVDHNYLANIANELYKIAFTAVGFLLSRSTRNLSLRRTQKICVSNSEIQFQRTSNFLR